MNRRFTRLANGKATAAAMQAKLDGLIRALNDAREQFIGIEHLPDTEIEENQRPRRRGRGLREG
jgi:low affinity Fe/Cu permease